MPTVCIYKIYWPDPISYFYIGQSTNFTSRKSVHISLLNKGKHDNQILQRVYNKYGLPLFEIIKECGEHELPQLEQYYLDLHFNIPKCCNMLPASKSSAGYKHTAETKQKFKERMSLPEVRKFLSDINIGNKRAVGRKHSEQTKLKISKAHKGRKRTENQMAAFRKWSKELKAGGTHPNSGRAFSDQHKKRISESRLGVDNPNYGKIALNAKKVIDNSSGKIYVSVKECSTDTGIAYHKLKAYLTGRSRNKTTIAYI